MISNNTAVILISSIGLVGCIFFMLMYHVRSRGDWRFNEIGVWLMFSRANLASIFALLLANRIWGDWTGRREIILILVAAFALQTFWPSRILLQLPHVAEKTEKQKGEDSVDSR